MYALNIDKETNRVLSATYEQYAPIDAIKVGALPEGNLNDWLYYDDAFHYDPLPEEESNEEIIINPSEEVMNAVYAEMATAIR